MNLTDWAAAIACGLMLAGCGADRDDKAGANAAAVAANESAKAGGNTVAGGLSDCPFRRTHDWIGSVEGGHVRVNGYVDLQMAGFRPELTPRPGAAGGTIAFDLALVPAPNAPVEDHVRYERRGAPAYRRAEIWCGGERIAGFDMIVVN